jgi:hypothetical protein
MSTTTKSSAPKKSARVLIAEAFDALEDALTECPRGYAMSSALNQTVEDFINWHAPHGMRIVYSPDEVFDAPGSPVPWVAEEVVVDPLEGYPSEPGEGYRFLTVGEPFQEGDEFFFGSRQGWSECHLTIYGKPYDGSGRFRRKVESTAPQTCEEGYRFLEAGEYVKPGDEMVTFSGGVRGWIPVTADYHDGTPVCKASAEQQRYRRKEQQTYRSLGEHEIVREGDEFQVEEPFWKPVSEHYCAPDRVGYCAENILPWRRKVA